ncbi:MAG: hypothetical protein WC773_03550 [Patescibacteria group bacterium]|jgi:uncharacterized HAD superfamily protein
MKIAFDFDDVLTDFVSEFLRYCNENDGTSFVLSDVLEYDLQPLFKRPHAEIVDKVFKFYQSGSLKSLQPQNKAVDVVEKLSKDHELIVITSRPTQLTAETTSWLDSHFPQRFSKIILTHHFSNDGNARGEKNDVCLREKVDLIIDDSPEWAEKCANSGVRVLLFDRPWNHGVSDHKNIIRIKQLTDVLQVI